MKLEANIIKKGLWITGISSPPQEGKKQLWKYTCNLKIHIMHKYRHAHTSYCSTNIFLREVTGASNALIVDVNLQLLDHVRQPIGHSPQQCVHVGHVWTKWHHRTQFDLRFLESNASCKIRSMHYTHTVDWPSLFSCRIMLWHSPCRNCRWSATILCWHSWMTLA